MINQLIKALSNIDHVVGIVYGGSRGLGINSEASDYDVVIYFDGERKISNEVLLENIPANYKINANPALITGEDGDVKFEIFQKSILKIREEIQNNLQGKFNWRLAPLFPYGDLSYRQVSHLVNYKKLWDKEEILQNTIALVSPFPVLFKKSVTDHFIKQINNTLIHLKKVTKKEDQFHFISLIGLIFFCYYNIIYVVNNRYPIIEKGHIYIASNFSTIPVNLMSRMSAVYNAAASLQFEIAYELLHTLVVELKSIVHEDQKK